MVFHSHPLGSMTFDAPTTNYVILFLKAILHSRQSLHLLFIFYKLHASSRVCLISNNVILRSLIVLNLSFFGGVMNDVIN